MSDTDVELGPVDYIVVEWPAISRRPEKRSRTSSISWTGDWFTSSTSRS